MENFKFTFVSFFLILVLAGVGVLGYMALERGDESGLKQRVAKLEAQVTSQEKALAERDRKIAQLETDLENTTAVPVDSEPVATSSTSTTASSSSSSSSSSSTTSSALLTELRNLRSRGVVLEPGDSGAAVGTIQKFLNEYNNTSGGVDNDFGPGTRTKVEAFQNKEGLTPDGGVGPTTLARMITWLENN